MGKGKKRIRLLCLEIKFPEHTETYNNQTALTVWKYLNLEGITDLPDSVITTHVYYVRGESIHCKKLSGKMKTLAYLKRVLKKGIN